MEKLKYLKYQKILLLEDDSILLENYTNIFKDFFSEVISINNCHDAYQKVKESQPNLIIVDVHLKNDNQDGLDFIKMLRDEKDKTPVIVFSALSEPQIFHKAIPLKIIDYYVKPVNYNDIINALKKYILELENSDKFIINLGDNITFNFFSYELIINGKVENMPLNARKLLALLLGAKGTYVTYALIENEIYFQKDFYLTTIRNHVSMIRAILGKDSIIVSNEQGYKFKND